MTRPKKVNGAASGWPIHGKDWSYCAAIALPCRPPGTVTFLRQHLASQYETEHYKFRQTGDEPRGSIRPLKDNFGRMKPSCIIIDDEPPARNGLNEDLIALGIFTVAGMAGDAEQA